MNVFRLVYCSRGVEDQNLKTLTALIDVAQALNKRDGLSGILCYSAPYFFQCLEGPRAAVSRTLARIYRDPRHTDLQIMDARFVPDRCFPTWTMELVPAEQVPRGLVHSAFEEAEGEYGEGRLQAERMLNFLEQMSRGGALPAPAALRRPR